MERLLVGKETRYFAAERARSMLFRLNYTWFASFLRSWFVTYLLALFPEDKKAKTSCESSSSRNPNSSSWFPNQTKLPPFVLCKTAVLPRLFRGGNLVFSSGIGTRYWDCLRLEDGRHDCAFLAFFSSKTWARDKWPSLDIELIPGKCALV